MTFKLTDEIAIISSYRMLKVADSSCIAVSWDMIDIWWDLYISDCLII